MVGIRLSRALMNTTFELTLSVNDQDTERAEADLTLALQNVADLENEITEFKDSSPIYRLNREPQGTWIELSERAADLVRLSQDLARVTQGAFNPCAKSGSHWEDLQWDGSRVHKTCAEAHWGFGAIGKGYALDLVAGFLSERGWRDFSLSAGGSSIVLSGAKAAGSPWSWAWAWERDEAGQWKGSSYAHSSGAPIALGISGFQEQGEHILGTRWGDEAPPLSQLVASGSAALADALSTAAFALPEKEAFRILESVAPGAPSARISTNSGASWSAAFEKIWGPAFSLGLMIWSAAAQAQETVDLGALTADSFTPYSFERNSWWILLPASFLALVFWHLKSSTKKNTDLNAKGRPQL